MELGSVADELGALETRLCALQTVINGLQREISKLQALFVLHHLPTHAHRHHSQSTTLPTCQQRC